MRVAVNVVRLYFDVEGAGLVPDGPVMRERPTVVMVHGGPGVDHTHFKPFMSFLADDAQVIYYDHRGMGRSDYGKPEHWNIAQWADDLAGLLDALDIENPYIVGASFGGFVAQAFASRHPKRLAKLALLSTGPRFDTDLSLKMFERAGGPEAVALATRFLGGDMTVLEEYFAVCLPHYIVDKAALLELAGEGGRAVQTPETMMHFFGVGGERHIMDLRPGLANIQCPTLIVNGDADPILPAPLGQEIYDAISPGVATRMVLEDCGHGWVDKPEAWQAALKQFLFDK